MASAARQTDRGSATVVLMVVTLLPCVKTLCNNILFQFLILGSCIVSLVQERLPVAHVRIFVSIRHYLRSLHGREGD